MELIIFNGKHILISDNPTRTKLECCTNGLICEELINTRVSDYNWSKL